MRTDQDIRTDIISELDWDPSIRHEDIATAVNDAVVTLAGTVDSYAQRYSAECAVARVQGVSAIVNDLAVKLPGAMVRSDADLAHAAVSSLRWHSEVPEGQIRLRVEDGWLTLEGEVDWHFQKEAAEQAVRHLTGARGLTSLITLRAMPTVSDIKQLIRTTMKRQAELDADHVTVEMAGSRVVLRGMVRSVSERRDAERAAWNAPGVAHVNNEIVVSPLLLVGV